MKIKELKKGMLLTPAGDNECFSVWGNGLEGANSRWVKVRTRPSRNWPNYGGERICETKVMMYLGTKKDLNLNVMWTDKFVLIENEIVGVDPAAWRRIKNVTSQEKNG